MRARAALDAFVAERGVRIAARYVENESGAKLNRPELFRLLDDCDPGDILLVEQVDRLSRLTGSDWAKLCAEIDRKEVRIVALDLPTSWNLAEPTDEFTSRMFVAINKMMLDVLAAVARKDYEDRRRRQAEGVARGRAAGLYRGRRPDAVRNEAIAQLLREGKTWSFVITAAECSRTLVASIARQVKAERAAQGANNDAVEMTAPPLPCPKPTGCR